MNALMLIPLLIAQPPAIPFDLVAAKPRPDLAARFVRASGWTGSDCAYSIRLGPTRTLWLFGDTWIGDVRDGKRVHPRMINNTAAWQELPSGAMKFFWNDRQAEPASLLLPTQKDHWYWPGDGALVDGKLFMVWHVIRHKAQGAPGFQFEWVADDLLRIDNPEVEPTRWTVERRPFGPELNLGIACVADGDYFYSFGLIAGPRKPLTAPLAVARIHRAKLASLDMDAWESWAGGRWQAGLKGASAILDDGASEMSIQRVRGLDGFVAVYMPLGLSRDIVVRHAARPEGPWSAPLKVHRVPAEAKDVYVYAAKGHAELAERDGQLIVTYCRNVGALSEHMTRPLLYAPQVVEVQLKRK